MIYINFTPFPALKTDKFILRKSVKSDAQYIFKLRSDKIYSKFTGIKRYETIGEAVLYLDKIDRMIDKNEAILWSIVIKGTNEYIGGICLWNISDDKAQAEIGYDLLPEFRSKGYIQEAIQCVINYAFEILKLDKIVAEEVHSENIKSIKVLEKSGFKFKRSKEFKTDQGLIERRVDYILLNHVDKDK